MLAQMLERFDLPRSPASARKLGLSKTSFYRYLSLLNAPPDIRQALQRGEIGVMQAEKLASVDDPEDRGRLLRVATQGSPNNRRSMRNHDNQGEAFARWQAARSRILGVLISADSRAGQAPQDRAGRHVNRSNWPRTLGLDIEVLSRIRKALNSRPDGRGRGVIRSSARGFGR